MTLRHAAAEIALRHVIDWALFVAEHHARIDWQRLERTARQQHMLRFLHCLNAIAIDRLGLGAETVPAFERAPPAGETRMGRHTQPRFRRRASPTVRGTHALPAAALVGQPLETPAGIQRGARREFLHAAARTPRQTGRTLARQASGETRTEARHFAGLRFFAALRAVPRRRPEASIRPGLLLRTDPVPGPAAPAARMHVLPPAESADQIR